MADAVRKASNAGCGRPMSHRGAVTWESSGSLGAVLRDRPGGAVGRPAAVLVAYALIQQRRHGGDPEIGAVLHRGTTSPTPISICAVFLTIRLAPGSVNAAGALAPVCQE